MASKSFSFCTSNDIDTAFVDHLRIHEHREGRANFSWVVIQALKEYSTKRIRDKKLLEEARNG